MQPATVSTIAFSWSILGFALYYFLFVLNPSGKQDLRALTIQRLGGVLFLGVVPLLLLFIPGMGDPAEFGLHFGFSGPPPWWSYLLIPLIIVASFFQSSSPGNLAQYPQVRDREWTHRTLLISGAGWVAFLLAYEFFFRGFILFASLKIMEPLPAVALNCALYGFAHFYKGPGETFGAIPLGIVVSYLSILTGNIWCAVVIHSCMALSNEWFSLRAHPDMRFVRRTDG